MNSGNIWRGVLRLLLGLCVLGGGLGAKSGDGASELAEGSGEFVFATGPYVVPVWYHRPVGFRPSDPVLFVMHGVGRNADEYRDQWVALAEAHRALLVVPEFSRKQFPGAAAYNLGNVYDSAHRERRKADWAYTVIEPVFDEVRRRSGSTRETYALYGHSAGAQFVHRYLYFVPEARVSQVVSANAGWYTMPDYAMTFPYGLDQTNVTEATLRAVLQRPLIVLLGSADTDPNDPSLRHTAEADAQGPFRLARGEKFFARAKAQAAAFHVPFGWHKVYAPGVAHSNADMAVYASEWLFATKP